MTPNHQLATQNIFGRKTNVRTAVRSCIGVVSCVLVLFAISGSTCPTKSSAQVIANQPQGNRNPLPRNDYYAVFPQYYQGEYKRAIRRYQQLLRSPYKDVNGPFFDSVCYLTMLGECYYQAGDFGEAVELYESAIKIYINRSIWEPRTQVPATIAADSNAVNQARVTWYRSTRTTTIGTYPRTYSYLFGRMDNERVLSEGGVIQNPQARPVDMAEALRCTSLALYRRRELKGPTCKYDPLTRQFLTALTSQKLNSNSVVGAWKSILAGLAYAANEDWNKAAGLLKGALQIGGRFDHPLTPIALAELGNIAFRTGKFSDATGLYLEASHSAAVFEQYDLIEHSLRRATTSYQVQNPTSVFTPLENAIAWAKRERARFVEASLLVEMAHNYAELGQGDTALKLISRAKQPMQRNDISGSTVNSRMWYVSALTKFQSGNGRAATADFDRFLKQFRTKGCKWTYQLALADNLVVANRVDSRQADGLYTRLLRQPTPADWLAQPMETLTYLLTPHAEPLERWFEIAVSQRKIDKAIDISQALRQHRFYSQLAFGGRLLAFRWILEAPEKGISAESLKQRKRLMARFGAYKKLSDYSKEIQSQLTKLPVAPEIGTAESKQQKRLLLELAKTSASQETLLSGLALMRIPSEFCFPPQVPFKAVQSELADKQVIVYCVATKASFHIFLIARDTYTHVGNVRRNLVRSGVAKLLKDIGSVDRTAAVPVELLQGEKWKDPATKLMQVLLPNRNKRFWEAFDQAIIVPDGVAWYLPWEVLQIDNDGSTKSFGDLMKVRYLPALGLAAHEDELPSQFDRSAVVIGRLTAKDTVERTKASFDQIKAANPAAGAFESKLNGPSSAFAAGLDELIVWTDVKEKPGFGMSPMQIDRGQVGSTMGQWLALPWRTPQVVIVPGFSSSAASGLRSAGNGNDLFLTTCSLMAGGTKTVLISRWNVGGSTALDLTREFAMQLPEQSAVDAWKRSKLISAQAELAFEAESRIKIGNSTDAIKANHPFFWAGYMLHDMGRQRGDANQQQAEEKQLEKDE